MWNDIFCSKCKSYSPGESSVCYDKNSGRYEIISGYGSDFDMSKIYLVPNFKNEEELRERFPWITNIGQQFNNLCDECIRKMLYDKEARAECHDIFIAPFYTACCDKYITEVKQEDLALYLQVEKINKFPYLSRYIIISWEDQYKYERQDFEGQSFLVLQGKEFFNYYPYCTVCLECFSTHYLEENCSPIEEHPVLYNLRTLKNDMESYLDFHLREDNAIITRFSCQNEYFKEEFIERFYMYQARKNMLELKEKLKSYFLKRNLNIIRKYIYIPKDIYNLILHSK